MIISWNNIKHYVFSGDFTAECPSKYTVKLKDSNIKNVFTIASDKLAYGFAIAPLKIENNNFFSIFYRK